MREFAYVSDGPPCVLIDGWWWTYHDGGEVRDRVLEDDGKRGWLLSARLRHSLGLVAVV